MYFLSDMLYFFFLIIYCEFNFIYYIFNVISGIRGKNFILYGILKFFYKMSFGLIIFEDVLVLSSLGI